MRAREFIKELDVYPIAGQESDPYGQRTDIVGGGANKKLGPGTASVQGMAMTSPEVDATRIDKNVSANYALPLGDGGISAGVTRTAGSPNNQFNIQGSVPLAGGNFSAGVSRTKDQPNNFNLAYSRQVGPGQLDVGINKQGQGGPAQGQIRYNMPFNEEDARSQEFVAEYKKYPTADYEGVTFTMAEEDGFLTVKALNDFGISMASVIFGMDGRDLDPQSLRVDEKYRGQGIARVMYDYVKSRGFVIHRSWDQTDAGAGFWDKHRGEDVRVWEAFNKPYKGKWEKSDYGDVDMLTKLPDGTNLSIMFNQEYGDEGEEVVQVEFYRNNSQEVTGEGDAQRIFATVLDAIQKYIKKYKPQRLSFSASKAVDMDADNNGAQFNPESRAKLYDRLVQRYSKALGYRAFRADNGDIVIYELSRLGQGVAEEQLDELSFLGSECTKDCSGHRAGYDWSKRKGLRQANSWSPSFNKGAGLAVAGK